MSNPANAVWQLQSDLAGQDQSGPVSLTGVEPIRFDGGLWLEQGTINLCSNPVAASNTTNWQVFGVKTMSRVTSLPAPLPGELAGLVTTGLELGVSGDAGTNPSIVNSPSLTLTDADHTVTIYLWIPSNWSGGAIRMQPNQFTSVVSSDGQANMALKGQWQRVAMAVNPDAGDVLGLVQLFIVGTWTIGETLVVTGLQPELGTTPTSLALSTMGAGYSSGSGTHIRAASSAAISPSGILAPGSGSLAFRLTPTIETGLEEIWGECGVKGAGTDHLRWGRDSTKHPFCEWSANNAAYQRLTASETVDAGTAYDLYLGHDGTDVSLSVDAGTANTGTRDAVSASFGAGDLTLKASAGGVIYDEFATFDRVLTNYEIARLNAAPTWSLVTLAANTQTRRIRQQFQLRSY